MKAPCARAARRASLQSGTSRRAGVCRKIALRCPGGILRVISDPRMTISPSFSPYGAAISHDRSWFVGRSSLCGWYSMWSVIAIAS